MNEGIDAATLRKAAKEYLTFVSSKLATRFDLSQLPKGRQQSTWMVASGATGYSSQVFERDVP